MESNSGRVESSTSAHPERETSPGSMGCLVLLPRAPSSVRVVPWRFSGSSTPGCQTTCLPSTVRVIEDCRRKMTVACGYIVEGQLVSLSGERLCRGRFAS